MASTTNLNLIPAATPPPGQQPHFVNPPNDNAPFIAWLAIYIVVSTPLVGMRVYTREFVTRQLWWDDCTFSELLLMTLCLQRDTDLLVLGTCILGWAFLMALVGMQFRGLQLGGAADTWNVTKADRNEYEKVRGSNNRVVEPWLIHWNSSSRMRRSSLESACSSPRLPFCFSSTACSSLKAYDGPRYGGASG